jgi:hypothetical protein
MLVKVRDTEGMIFTCPVSNLRAGEWDLRGGRMLSKTGTCYIEPDLFAKYYRYDGSKIQEALNEFIKEGMGQSIKEDDLRWLEEQIRRVVGSSDYDEIPESGERCAYLGQEFWARTEGIPTTHMPCYYCGSTDHDEYTELLAEEIPHWCPLRSGNSGKRIRPNDFAEYYKYDASRVNQALKNYRFWGEGRNLAKEEEYNFSQQAMETCFDSLRELTMGPPIIRDISGIGTQEHL